jgi:hypothetical protein
MAAVWSDIVDGTATGPIGIVQAADGDVIAEAVWDDEVGVQVALRACDVLLTMTEVTYLIDLLTNLLSTPAPIIA